MKPEIKYTWYWDKGLVIQASARLGKPKMTYLKGYRISKLSDIWNLPRAMRCLRASFEHVELH